MTPNKQSRDAQQGVSPVRLVAGAANHSNFAFERAAFHDVSSSGARHVTAAIAPVDDEKTLMIEPACACW
jgi:hypothetical protein